MYADCLHWWSKWLLITDSTYGLHGDCVGGGPSEHYSTLELHGDCVGGGPSEHESIQHYSCVGTVLVVVPVNVNLFNIRAAWGLCWWWSQ